MKQNWSRSELIMALDLYCRLPFGRFHRGNPDVINLAKEVKRTPSAVALKLSNFARLDPTLRARGVSGMSHGARGDEKVWREFFGRWEKLAEKAAELKSQVTGQSLEELSEIAAEDLPPPGRERDAIVKIRIGQTFFRSAVLAAYDFRCCVTGLGHKELLNASHIVPWATDPANRLNPQNGLCLNALHDRAFDRGLITIDSDFRVVVSKKLKGEVAEAAAEHLFFRYHGHRITLPTHFGPNPEFLKNHSERFRD